jgi:pimeloyl-ACP methyl ester carboxylesterase
LAQDTFALAEAAGFDNGHFHLVGHDHGAGLAWYVAGNDPEKKVLSLTTMSVPHIDFMSDALCGKENTTDETQVIASNYFNQFSLPDSATINNASLTNFF